MTRFNAFTDEELNAMKSAGYIRVSDNDAAPTRKKGKCEFCEQGKPLAIGKTNDQGIAIRYPNILNAYGYDVHGFGSNGISVKINYCPICGSKMIDPQKSEGKE